VAQPKLILRDPSTPLRFAQDDKLPDSKKTNADPIEKVRAVCSTSPLAMELREAAMRMTHLYWYGLGYPFADPSSSTRLAGLLYVDTN
jgi:hypothetical protein